MKDIINDKIRQIDNFIEELYPSIPETFEEYEKDFKTRAICERYLEKIIEALVDLAFLVIKDKKIRIPKEDGQAFIILAENNIIGKELALKLRDAKGMRNIIAHEYGEIDDSQVFNSVKHELIDDANEFIKSIEKAR